MFIKKKVSTGTTGKEFQLIAWGLQGRSASWCPAPKAPAKVCRSLSAKHRRRS